MQKVVVFGGTGYIGSYVSKMLAAAGYEVVCISKSGTNKYLNKAELDSLRLLKADVFKPQDWAAELENCYAVVNCIGILFQEKQTGITFEKMILGSTKQIANAAVEKGVSKFVQISAIKPPFFMLQEYHRYKQEAEAFLKQQPFELKIIRPRIVVANQKPFFLLLYKLQELVHFPWKQFEHVRGIAREVVLFLG